MKKFIACLLFAVLLILPANPLFATDESVSFLNALSNFSKVEDYKLMQSFFGNVEIEEGEDHLTAEYRFTVNSAVNGGATEASLNRLNAFIKFTNHNVVTDSTPFKEMIVQASAEINSQNQQDLYVKLSNFNVSLKDPLPIAVSDIENAKSMVNMYKGIWFHSSVETLATENLQSETGTAVDVQKYLAFEEQFKEQPKEAILGLSEMALKDSNSNLSEEEMTQAMEGIKMVLETQLFTTKNMTGLNNGTTFFSLNKASIINFLQQFAVLVGEELTIEDLAMIRSVLGKISLSGTYHIEDAYGIIDNLLVRLKIKETGPVKMLEVNYRLKTSDLNQENDIAIPTTYQELSEISGAEGGL